MFYTQGLILRANRSILKSVHLHRGYSGLVYVNCCQCPILPASHLSAMYLKELEYILPRSNISKIGAVYFDNKKFLVPACFVETILNSLSTGNLLSCDCEVTMSCDEKNAERLAACLEDYENVGVNRLCMRITEKLDVIDKFSSSKSLLCFDFTLPCACSTTKKTSTELEFNNLQNFIQQMISRSSHMKFEQSDCMQCMNSNKTDDLFVYQYDYVKKTMESAGFTQYKFCHFGKQSQFSKFMTLTSLGSSYIGLGPSSHGRFICSDTGRKVAYTNEEDTLTWLNCVKRTSNGIYVIKPQSDFEVLEELLMLGLDTRHGIDLETWMQYSNGITFEDFKKDCNTAALIQEGILTINGKHLAISEKYWIVSDSINNTILEFVEKYFDSQ